MTRAVERGFGQPPARIEAVPGTPFALAYPAVPRASSGPAIASLVAGIGSLLVMLAAGCFGLIGAQRGVGALVGGAFGVLAGLLGVAGIALAVVGRRQIRGSERNGWTEPANRAEHTGWTEGQPGPVPPPDRTGLSGHGLSGHGLSGRGLAMAGLVCGAIGIGLTALIMVGLLLA